MIFDKLADGIIRHHKAIIVIWAIILICAVPLAIKAPGVMSYDVTSMAGEDSESMQGLVIIGQNFPSSSADISSTPIVVIKYEDRKGLEAAELLLDNLNANASSLKTDDGIGKLSSDLSSGPFVQVSASSDGSEPGVMLVGVIYSGKLPEDFDVSSDTPNLRGYISDALTELRETNSDALNIAAYLTGTTAINYDTKEGAMSDITKIDPFTILLILVLVGLFFRSFISSATPPVTIGVAFAVVMAIIYGLGTIFDIFFITEIMLLVSMMGAGCDYCIFIIARYREGLRNGMTHEDALHDAVKWAGESITVSGISVIIGFGAMSICSFSLVSMLGVCLALGIVIALLAALTFIPSLLAIVGDRIYWPSTMKTFEEGGKSTRGWYAWCGKVGQRYFERSSKFSLSHAKAITVAAIIITLPAAYIALTSETSYDMTGAMETGDSGTGMDLIGEYADEGMLMPNYVVIRYSKTLATVTVSEEGGTLVWTDDWYDVYEDLKKLVDDIVAADSTEDEGNIGQSTLPFMWSEALKEAMVAGNTTPEAMITWIYENCPASVSQVLAIIIPTLEDTLTEMYMAYGQSEDVARYLATMALATDEMAPTIDYYVNVECATVGGDYVTTGSGTVTYVKISIPTVDAAMSSRSMESLTAISSVTDAYAESSDIVTQTWMTGTAAVMYEVSEVIGGEFTNIELLVAVLIIVLLFFVMKSYTIPFRSVFTILMSICWTLALTHILFVDVLGGEVIWLIPLILFVICLGLGMDYDILLTTRIKENVRFRGLSNDEAIHRAVLSTGSVITICGLIMGGAFGTLMLSSMEMLQEFGFALCFAIVVDALVVRTYIVPAVMHLLGDWNWKGPKFLQGKEHQ